MATKKQFIAIVNDPTGNLITTWSSFAFAGFSKSINNGLGECVITMPFHFDYEGYDLQIGNDVEIRVSDKDTLAQTSGVTARTIYRGYISLIERQINGGDEGCVVHLLGYATKMAVDMMKSTTHTTLYSYATGLTITGTSNAACDVGQLVRAILDLYVGDAAGQPPKRISYDPMDVPNTGTSVTYTFTQLTYRDALDQCRKMAPAGTYFYINEKGMVRFGPKPALPTHRFVLGRDFNKIAAANSIENTRNFFLLWDGKASGTYKHYEDPQSVASYGRRVEAETDFGVSAVNAADAEGAKFIAESKDAGVIVTATIMDNNDSDNFGYDIESIQPGDTCSFAGFTMNLGHILRDNALITNVDYMPDRVVLTIEIVRSGLVEFQSQQGKSIDAIQSGGLGVGEIYG